MASTALPHRTKLKRQDLAAIAGFVSTARADRARQVDQQLDGALPPPYEWSIMLGGQAFAVSLATRPMSLVDGAPVEIGIMLHPRATGWLRRMLRG
jgi:propionyl-CoA carboxylase alpha chain